MVIGKNNKTRSLPSQLEASQERKKELLNEFLEMQWWQVALI
jgi:hypothetical protein